MRGQGRLFAVEGPFCAGCSWHTACGAAYTDKACGADWGKPELGGGQVLHPAFEITRAYMSSVDGPGFDDVLARAVRPAKLPHFFSQIRMRSSLRSELSEDAYGVTVGSVVRRRARILAAAEVREFVGLRDDQALVLLLFGEDAFLNRLWNEGPALLPQVAEAGYDVVIGPSFSTWEPRPRPEYLIAVKQSLLVFEALQSLGANAVPRVASMIDWDVQRWAGWLDANPGVEFVALDLTTYRGDYAFRQQVDLLARLDELTNRRITYLINGPSDLGRVLSVYSATSPERVHITNARAIARDGAPGTTFSEKAATERRVVAAARRTWMEARGKAHPVASTRISGGASA